MKPLSIEELKALEVGDWVWIVTPTNTGEYYQKFFESDEDYFAGGSLHYGFNASYEDYDTKWLAYKNKEREEDSNAIRRFSEYVGSKITGHSDYHGDSILSALYCAAEGKEIKDITPLEPKGEIMELPKATMRGSDAMGFAVDYYAKKTEYFKDKVRAKRRIEELKGE